MDETPLPPVVAPSAPSRRNVLLIAAVVAVLIVVAAGVYYLFLKPDDPEAAARKEAQQVIAAVGKLIMLPADEEPVIATVADPALLADQPFFKNASKGDRVLIYNIAKKAILYNPGENRIVDVAPLSTPTPTPTPRR